MRSRKIKIINVLTDHEFKFYKIKIIFRFVEKIEGEVNSKVILRN